MLEQCCLTYICAPRKNLVHFSRMIQHLECCSPLLFKYYVIPIASYPCSLCMQLGTAVLLKCTHICHIGLGGGGGGVRMQALSPELILGGPAWVPLIFTLQTLWGWKIQASGHSVVPPTYWPTQGCPDLPLDYSCKGMLSLHG